MEDLDHKFNCLNINEILPDSIKLMCYYGIVSPIKKYKLKYYSKYVFINATYLCAHADKVYNDEITGYLMNNLDKIKFIDTEEMKNCTIQYIYLKEYDHNLSNYGLNWSYYWDQFKLSKLYTKKTNIYKNILKNKNNSYNLDKKLHIIVDGYVKYKFRKIKLYRNIRKNYIKLKK